MQPENTGRKQGGRFAPGTSGNRKGRPRGTRNVTTRAVEALLGGEAEGIARAAVAAALGGDVAAMKMILDRVAPVPRYRCAPLRLPQLADPADLPVALMELFNETVAGAVAPADASDIAKLGETYRRAYETVELDQRLATLEAAVAGGRPPTTRPRSAGRGPK